MSTVIEFTVPAEACALGRSLGDDPRARLELDRVVPTGDTVMPFFWVWNRDPDAFVEAARDEEAIEEVTIVDRVDDGALLSARWNREAAGTLFAIARTQGALLDARVANGEWRFEVRFDDTASTAEFRQFCADYGVPLSIQRVASASPREDDRFGLTTEQREALTIAYEQGYFAEPRSATLEDVANALGISPRAVAGRLRRGQATLLERTGLSAPSEG